MQDGECAVHLPEHQSSFLCLVGPLLRKAHMGADESAKPGQVYATWWCQSNSYDKAVAIMTRYIGLDVHKDYIHSCEWIPHEAKEKHFRLKNNPDAWAGLAEKLGPDCEVAVEVTGNAFELYDALSPHCARMVLANPSALKRFGSGQHTDRVDATRLAKMMAMNTVPPVRVPPQEVREVRRLLQYRFKLVQQAEPLRFHTVGRAPFSYALSAGPVLGDSVLPLLTPLLLIASGHNKTSPIDVSRRLSFRRD